MTGTGFKKTRRAGGEAKGADSDSGNAKCVAGMYLIVGLGNPGSRYENTRHNAGFMLVDRLAGRLGADFGRGPGKSLICRVELGDASVLLAKPQTFMNLSGGAVRELSRYYRAELSRLLVAYDEVALPLGRIRIRKSGSAGGHKGMASVIQALGAQDVARLRIGIRGERPARDLSRYVLSDFDRSETETLEQMLERAADAVQAVVSDGLERAMALYN